MLNYLLIFIVFRMLVVGGALAFNSIYVILREHEYIVDEFWLELLYKFVCSLKLNNNEIEDDACISALSHVKRVLSEKSEFFKTVCILLLLLFLSVKWQSITIFCKISLL